MIRKSLVLGFLAAAALSQAATFNTIVFSSDVAGVTATYSSPTTDSYLATIDGLMVGPNQPLADVAWVFQFDTPVPYKAVDLTIHVQSGDVGKLTVFASETVVDISTNPWTTVLETSVEADPGGSLFDIVFHLDPFTYPVTKGEVRKDILFYADGGDFNILGIEQNFTPVPEPASMLVLAGGAAALIARRRRK